MKADRLETILELIIQYNVDGQESLRALLAERGFDVTQATVSRDIKRLGLIKTDDGSGISRYMKPKLNNASHSIFSDSVTGVDYGMNTIVLKCKTGMAQAACTLLDSMKYPDIVGTLAGDDTIFILMRSETDARNLCRRFNEELGLKGR